MQITIDMKATGEMIREKISEKGFSVRQIADMMGFEKPQAVYKWLEGRTLPTVDNLIILGRLLDTNIEGLLVYEIKDNP